MEKERVCANDLSMSRRALLAATPAFWVAAPVVALSTEIAAPDPFLDHYLQWVEARNEWLKLAEMPGNDDWDWPESIAAESAQNEAFFLMSNLMPTSIEGFAAMAHLVWIERGFSQGCDSEEFQTPFERALNRIIFNLYAGLCGEASVPVADLLE